LRVAVVGGGIAGLAAAWALLGGEVGRGRAEVTVFEPGPLGGKLRTEEFCGHPVDLGPDAFLARVPDGLRLCRELGLADELVAPAAGKALLWTGGRLRPLPDGLLLGAPVRLGPLARSGLLSPLGLARAGLDLVLPRRPLPDDLSVAQLVTSRFGAQVADRLVDPLVGAIHAGRTDQLGAAATTPQLLSAARGSRSLLRGLARAASSGGGGPVFLAPRGGMGVLADRLVARLRELEVSFVPEAVTGLRPLGGRQVAVDPDPEPFDSVIVAVPAAVAARLLEPAAADAARGLSAIRTASVVLATLALPLQDVDVPPGISGFLVPRSEGRLMTACSFGSRKWPHWSSPDTMVVRVSAGRAGDDRPQQLDDQALVTRLSEELASALDTPVSPSAWRVSRWPGSFPQFEVAHLDRVAAIESALGHHLPQVALAGASYRGSGIASCIASGRRAASSVLAGSDETGAAGTERLRRRKGRSMT
jgi:oxygen-dependent protoporphyrinogen oxidase